MKWKPYPKNKDSGADWLGEIPNSWDVKRLKRCVKLINEKCENISDGSLYIGLENIESWTGKLIANGNITDSDALPNSFKSSDVLFNKLRPYLAKILIPKTEGTCTGELLVLRTKNNLINNFLFYYLLSKDFINTVDSSTYGSKMPRANWEFIGNLPTLIPTFEEQQAIVTFLNRETERIDSLIAKKQRQIELLQEKLSALISHVATKSLDPNVKMKDSGVEWLGEIPEHWVLQQLKFLCIPHGDAIKTGPFGSQLLSSEMNGGTIKVYNQRNVLDDDFQEGDNYITEEKFIDLKAFSISPGDLLVTTRGTIGRCALFPTQSERGILHPCLMRIQPDSRKIIPEFLSLLIQSSDIVKTQLSIMSNATTIEVIYSDSLKQVRIPLPPITEQQQILIKIKQGTGKLDQLLFDVTKSISLLQEYRSALISAAVTGKIDVRQEI